MFENEAVCVRGMGGGSWLWVAGRLAPKRRGGQGCGDDGGRMVERPRSPRRAAARPTGGMPHG